MMMLLEQLISTALSDPITRFFAYLMCVIFFVGLLARLNTRSYFQSIAAIAPNILTTLGILGTFLGIAIGLVNFNVNNIDGSVPELLAGLKIAFLTSILGISSSLLLKVLHLVVPVRSRNTTTSPEDIFLVLEEMRDGAKSAAKSNQDGLEALHNIIASEGDSSLISQIQKLRTENRDGQNELITEFRDFATQMAENNQKALIEALKEVISDFNENLTEQFGENFKELNSAVHKLVEWQENYRQQVETLQDKIGAAVEAIAITEGAIQNIKEHTSKIPDAIRPVPSIMQSLSEQVSYFEKHLEALNSLRQQAIDAFPIIESNLNKSRLSLPNTLLHRYQKQVKH